ncbi:MAG: EAL domain-containing protein, partial [Betaproteobacteria bacterium]
RTQLELKRVRDWLADHNRILEEQVAARTAELQESETRYRRIAEGLTDYLYTVRIENDRSVETVQSPACAVVTGYTAEEFAANPDLWIQMVVPEDRELVISRVQHILAGNDVSSIEHRIIQKNGETRWISDTIILFKDASGKLISYDGVIKDITEKKRYQAQLERQANFDDLTGLPNRNLLADRLAQALARCRQSGENLAVLVFNLDHFKEINDSLGRGIGDKLLREVSGWLGTVSGTVDTLAHLGGDEFVLLAEDGEARETVSLAQSILNALAQPFLIEGRELFLSASIGIAIFPKDGEDGETLLNNAGAAMYRAKTLGGNSFNFYAAEMNARSLGRLNLVNELRHAVERGELRLYYQPQMSLRSGEIIGMEALVRWQHPVRGLVPPMEFIPLAEETGLILPIGEWVLRTACTQNQAWQAAGLPAVAVAVNLSARQFEGQDMVALTRQVLLETGLAPCYLELELTESAAMGNADTFVGILEALKGLSVTLSIDDFGTGYSSLSYLKRFALDRLKIDQSFVRDIVQDSDSAAIAVAVIALAHGLGLSVIAEGVETEEQLTFLRARGCDEMQGYYFSKPIPAADLEQLLRDRCKLALPTVEELPSLLLVDDEPSILSALKRLLRREGYPILTATCAEEGMELLAAHEVAVVMSDQRMPYTTGSEFLAKVRVMYPDTIRIILSGYTDLKAITEVVNRGEIFKFLEKPWDDAALLETLREAFRLYEARRMCRIGAS